ncbi:MAG: PQQ-dependent sugar dehydrogenase [Acidiferrobacterales bacterium]|nr:PQQ-dependent sugar dehydrogenase [Acidiferrobacterales bacterium]
MSLIRRFLLRVIILGLSTSVYAKDYKLETVATDLPYSWAMAFLPNGDLLLTERAGKLRIVRDGKLLDESVSGVPPVYNAGQGGLLDVMLDQNFAQNQTVYLSYSHGDRSANATRLLSATLSRKDTAYVLENQRVLFTASPLKSTAHHYGARIAQLEDGTLLLTVGDGFNYRESAQTLDNHFGKIVRINTDGSVPDTNPFISKEGALPEIYSYGHRNHQALVVSAGKIYENEHGPQGGDELNVIQAGINYGWPIATYGIDYTGARISPFTSYDGMRAPLIDWTPSIAPSSMAMHKEKLYVTSLAERSIRAITINQDEIVDSGVVFADLRQRMRDIVSGPDGHLYVLTDGDKAQIIRIVQ